MTTLARQRCFHHSHREAVARCPCCRQFFCRECVTEHEGRVLCAACLTKSVAVPLTRRPAMVGVIRSGQLLAGLVLTLIFFYWLGLVLLRMPSSFHEGTLWQGKRFEEGQ